MDMTWVFDKGVRKTLGERTLPDWKRWLTDNDVPLRPFLEKHYEGDLEEDLRRMRREKIDEWLFDFVQSPVGLQAARTITPDHPALESSGAYDPTEAILKAGPVAVGGRVVQATENQMLEGAPSVPVPRNFYRPGVHRKMEFKGVRVEVLGKGIELELNKREALFRYMKERKNADLDALPTKNFPEGSKIVICDSEGLSPELFVEGESSFRIVEEKEASVLDWNGEQAVRIVRRLVDVTGKTLDYGQADVTRQTYEASAVFILEDSS